MHLRDDRKSILSHFRASLLKTAVFVVAFAAIATAVFYFSSPSPALAQAQDYGLSAARQFGLSTLDIRQIIANVIRAALGLLGLVAVSIILYAGFKWMTAGDNPEQVNASKKLLINAGIGLLIIVSAYAIVSFIFSALGIGGGAGALLGRGTGQEPGGFGGALGNGPIQSHYPARNAVDVPRNTAILVTFKEAMDDATLITNGRINAEDGHVQIVTREQYDSGDTLTPLAAVRAQTVDHKTYVFTPEQYLGSPVSATGYVVILGQNILRADQQPIFRGAYPNYIWSFEVSNKLDVDPPTVTSVIPVYSNPITDDSAANTDIHRKTVARNAVVQINFSEPVNPLAVSGEAALVNGTLTFANIVVAQAIPSNNTSESVNSQNFAALTGRFEISNQYRTVEFVTDQECGVNSCGEKIYCLPGNAQLQVTLKAATLTNNPNPDLPFLAVELTDGVADVANNTMDGNANGAPNGNQAAFNLNVEALESTRSENPAGDNYQWGFYTNNTVDLVPPKVVNYAPVAQSIGVDPRQALTATFDKHLSASTIKSDAGYGEGYCGCTSDAQCNSPEESCDPVKGYCVAAQTSERIVCRKHSGDAECRSNDGSDQDETLCIEHEHVTLLQPTTIDSVGYYLMTQNDPNPAVKQSTTIMDHVAFFTEQLYGAYYGSGIRDLFQNCYIPNAAPGCPVVGDPGNYQAGADWLGKYPNCDLTKTTMSPYGEYSLGFTTASNVNRNLIVPAYSWDEPVTFVVDNLSTIDYFKSLPQVNAANMFLYFQQSGAQGAGNLYLVVYGGKDDAQAKSTARSLTVDISSVDGALSFNPATSILSSAVASLQANGGNSALRLVLDWTDQSHAYAIYPLGTVAAGSALPLNLQINPAVSTVSELRMAYPGGVQILNQSASFSLSAVDRQPPLVKTGDFEVKYTQDVQGNQYLVDILWNAGETNSDVASAYVDWTFSVDALRQYNLILQPLNDLGRNGDQAAGDLVWSYRFEIPANAYSNVAAAIADSEVLLNHLSEDYAGNSVQFEGGSPSDPIPATITSATTP